MMLPCPAASSAPAGRPIAPSSFVEHGLASGSRGDEAGHVSPECIAVKNAVVIGDFLVEEVCTDEPAPGTITVVAQPKLLA